MLLILMPYRPHCREGSSVGSGWGTFSSPYGVVGGTNRRTVLPVPFGPVIPWRASHLAAVPFSVGNTPCYCVARNNCCCHPTGPRRRCRYRHRCRTSSRPPGPEDTEPSSPALPVSPIPTEASKNVGFGRRCSSSLTLLSSSWCVLGGGLLLGVGRDSRTEETAGLEDTIRIG